MLKVRACLGRGFQETGNPPSSRQFSLELAIDPRTETLDLKSSSLKVPAGLRLSQQNLALLDLLTRPLGDFDVYHESRNGTFKSGCVFFRYSPSRHFSVLALPGDMLVTARRQLAFPLWIALFSRFYLGFPQRCLPMLGVLKAGENV